MRVILSGAKDLTKKCDHPDPFAVIPSEVGCQAVALFKGLEESLDSLREFGVLRAVLCFTRLNEKRAPHLNTLPKNGERRRLPPHYPTLSFSASAELAASSAMQESTPLPFRKGED